MGERLVVPGLARIVPSSILTSCKSANCPIGSADGCIEEFIPLQGAVDGLKNEISPRGWMAA
jgi:hypothetical protein